MIFSGHMMRDDSSLIFAPNRARIVLVKRNHDLEAQPIRDIRGMMIRLEASFSVCLTYDRVKTNGCFIRPRSQLSSRTLLTFFSYFW